MATLAIATLNRWVDRLAKPKYSSGDPLRSPCTTCTNGFSSIIHRPNRGAGDEVLCRGFGGTLSTGQCVGPSENSFFLFVSESIEPLTQSLRACLKIETGTISSSEKRGKIDKELQRIPSCRDDCVRTLGSDYRQQEAVCFSKASFP